MRNFLKIIFYIVKQLFSTKPCIHEIVALFGQIHAGLYADLAAANDHHILAQGIGIQQGVISNNMGLIKTWDGRLGRRGSQGSNDHIKACFFDQLRGCLGVELPQADQALMLNRCSESLQQFFHIEIGDLPFCFLRNWSIFNKWLCSLVADEGTIHTV